MIANLCSIMYIPINDEQNFPIKRFTYLVEKFRQCLYHQIKILIKYPKFLNQWMGEKVYKTSGTNT